MNLKGFMCTLALGMSLVACEKNVVAPNQSSTTSTTIPSNLIEGLQIQNGYADFETIQSYRDAVGDDQHAQVQQLTQHLLDINKDAYQNQLEEGQKDLIDDEFMAALLNKDQIVKIGDWFLQIKPEEEKVLVLSASNEQAYQTLVKGTDKSITKLSTNDEVLGYLENPAQMQKIFCSESGVASRDDEDYLYRNGVIVNPSSYNDALVEHRKFGVYFKLQAFVNNTKLSSQTPHYNRRVFFSFNEKIYKKRCKPQVNNSNTVAWDGNDPPFIYGSLAIYPEIKHVISDGTTNYHSYNIRLRAGFVDITGGGYVYNGTSGYIQIQAN